MKAQHRDIEIVSFGTENNKLLREFVQFHWSHYEDEPQYVPLLNYEYLGFSLIGIKGFFEQDNLFFRHAEMVFFLAKTNGRVVGRCNAFINHNHNQRWQDKVGFFGQFESVDDQQTADALLNAAFDWLKARGMETIRGPQNLPVNDATPGCLTEGFDSRPVMYYHYNKPYYPRLFEQYGMKGVMRVKSWEVEPKRPMEDKLLRLGQKIIDRYDVTIESWGERPLPVRKKEMLEIYNAAWNDNFGFVPFEEEEFNRIIDDMLLIMDKKLFVFLYVKGEAAAFFGGVPNVTELLVKINKKGRFELIRALKMILFKNRTKGFRLGYMGVKPKFRRLGLDGVMLWKQKLYSQTKYDYCDMGWVLEDNKMVIRLIEMMGSAPSKTYTVYEKNAG